MSTEKEVIRVPIVAGVVIKKDGRYLFVQEKQPSAYGLWNFPAGRVDVGETIEEAAIREAKEESGYDIELIRKIDIFQENAQEPAKHAFEARIIGGDLNFPKGLAGLAANLTPYSPIAFQILMALITFGLSADALRFL
jgi:ADP-ribose pyrophosphatase YjhB (NUDIX family)